MKGTLHSQERQSPWRQRSRSKEIFGVDCCRERADEQVFRPPQSAQAAGPGLKNNNNKDESQRLLKAQKYPNKKAPREFAWFLKARGQVQCLEKSPRLNNENGNKKGNKTAIHKMEIARMGSYMRTGASLLLFPDRHPRNG